MNDPVYVGRFAPSPTGPLHFGSLIAALASFLDARAAGGRWLLRIEDLDPPRESPIAAKTILDQLAGFGLQHDGEVLYQSTRHEAYSHALDQLRDKHLLFPCTCSRKNVGAVYDGRCRARPFGEITASAAIRCRVNEGMISIVDRLCGLQRWHLAEQVGDFIVRRRDGLYAYQLAVVVDDAFQAVTDVVRGTDLLESTPRQAYLAECLGLPQPRYAHLPIVTGPDGRKLSKQAHAAPVDAADALTLLRVALVALGQPDPGKTGNLTRMVAAAIRHWQIGSVPHVSSIPLSGLPANL